MSRLHNLRKDIKDRCLFDVKHLSVGYGQKIGLIGANGSGKTSLLKILAGLDEDYTGKVVLDTEPAYLPQLQPLSDLSGGQQTMHLFKRIMQRQTGLLLLDEPTANLDAENRDWLIHCLKKYRGTVIVVSHDRYFLREIAEEIWWLDKGKLCQFPFGYDETIATLELEKEQATQAYHTYQKKRKQLTEAASQKREQGKRLTKKKKSVSQSDWKVSSKMGSYDSKAKSLAKAAKALDKRIEQLGKVEQPRKEHVLKMKNLGHLNHQGHRLLHLTDGLVTVADRELFSFTDFTVNFGDKIALKGRNQAGKTSFIKQIIAKNLAGFYSPHLEIGYFNQNVSSLDEKKSLLDTVASSSLQNQDTILTLMASFGFPYHRQKEPVANLSGGERVKLSLVKLLLSDCNCLILDEPTNYLDLPTIEALSSFLRQFSGACILISHDKALLDEVADKHYLIEDSQLKVVDKS